MGYLGFRRIFRIWFIYGIFLDEIILISNIDSGEKVNYKWNSFGIGNERERKIVCR